MFAASHRPSSCLATRQKKEPRDSNRDINSLLNTESYKSETKGPGATPHCEGQTAGRPGQQSTLLRREGGSHLQRELMSGMAPHSSTLAWKIPWMEEPGRLQSVGSLRVGYDWATFLSLFTFMHWRRKWQPTPVFLPGESQGRGSLVGCRLWGCTESDTTEVT